ncbi:hypothetical protein HO133_006166 [Letharia lupina]|uniref:Uncharacterized protein n=1 Tax=Letharia lupina TaxID=560253 RepID=A0A8H6C748_9LECA|nr:uncharacterized protein HO133_006166 [Letharia lupina]KAF6218205.1 hypothetical protein HO133_006166 [Letharia lupina]
MAHHATRSQYGIRRYDDLDATPVLESPIDTYKSLTFNAFVLAGPSTPGVKVGGVANQSPPNAVLTSVTETLTNGTPSIVVAKSYKSWSL